MTRSILLVDDDGAVRQALGEALTSENYRVFSAANRTEALRELRQQPIDALLLDLDPQTEDGWETVGRLNALWPALPIVAMTARGEQKRVSGPRPVRALLEKPLDLPTLIQMLRDLTSRPYAAQPAQ
jgi:DNA-binding response OmpR family regulator